jgi:hypothetical protein
LGPTLYHDKSLNFSDYESDKFKIAGKIFDLICYFSLGGISIAGAFSSGEWNRQKANMHILLNDGEIVLATGEEQTFDNRPRLGLPLKYYYDSTPSDKIAPIQVHDETIHHDPIPADQTATAPFGGAVLSKRKRSSYFNLILSYT